MTALHDNLMVGSPAIFAGFWLRLVAIIIDSVILSILSITLWFIASISPGEETGGMTGEIVPNALNILLGWLYFAFLESSRYQATLGKQMMGIQVTDLEGNQLSFLRATVRHFAKIVSAIILLIGYIMVAFTEKKQALHDILAKTLVIRKEQEGIR
jgi:uncharacterized RDD family membrane protein YckC